MKFSNYIKEILINTTIIVIVILMYLVYVFYKIIVPGIVISYLTKFSLVVSILIYLSFILTLSIFVKLLNKYGKVKEDFTPLEDILD